MITRIEALNYRCLRHIDQRLGPFHVLVGPNASGKTTFLDVVSFLSDLVSKGLDEAINARTQNFQDLVWGRKGESFELAVEAEIPEDRRQMLPLEHQKFTTIRYKIGVVFNSATNRVEISDEIVHLVNRSIDGVADFSNPEKHEKRSDIVPDSLDQWSDESLDVARKNNLMFARDAPGGYFAESGFDTILSETFPHGDDMPEGMKRQVFPLRPGPRASTLAMVPSDEFFFPVTSWFKKLLIEGVQAIQLDGLSLKKPARVGHGRGFKTDGSNLPWAVSELRTRHKKRFNLWVSHLRTALPDLKDLRVVSRPEDNSLYILVRYENGVEVPSWMVSDGTLRLLALTILAYLPDFKGVFLIEEPENGIHPQAVETLFQSLSSVYDAQVFMATHSPMILGIVKPSQVLCFSRDADGATHIVRGDQHPALEYWRGETDLGTLFASGVLS